MDNEKKEETRHYILNYFQMHEALMLFDTTCNSHWFKTTSLILLLNKIDIFEKKLPYSPISDYFPDYKGKI
jgi:guanine nucleotide-binding protein subunit alpha